MKKILVLVVSILTIGLTSCGSSTGGTNTCTDCNWDWTLDSIPATCTEPSKDTAVCKNDNCDEIDERRGSINPLGHEGVADAIQPTCTTEGNTGTGTCTRCFEQVTGTVIPIDPEAHDWSEWELNAVQATCIEASIDTRTCKNEDCNKKEERTGNVLALGHESIGAVQPTCTTPGNTGMGTCTRCFETVTGDIIPIDPNAHNWSIWTTKTEVTCIAAKVEERTCSICQNVETQNVGVVNPTAHNWSTWTTKTISTCVATEVEERICSLCQNVETQNVGIIDPTAHSWSNWTTKTEATCIAARVETRTCLLCSIEDTQSVGAINPTAHDFTNSNWLETRPATCTVANEETRTCTRGCSYSETRSTITARGHSWSSWSLVTTPIITGQEARNCQRPDCIEIETRTAPATPGLVFIPISGGFSVDGSGEYTPASIVIIPAIHNGQPVIRIGQNAYWFTHITGIFIPNSVTTIGNGAFSSHSSLTSITISNSLTTIGDGAFAGCRGLTSITIPNSVTTIGDRAFDACSGLTSIIIPDSVTSIGEAVFRGCTSLTSITIPNNITTIGHGAFWNCTGLTSVTIPSSVMSIGLNVFAGCTNLTNINVDANNPNFTSNNGIVFNKAMTQIVIVPFGMSSVVLPNGLTQINDGAFRDYTGLTSIIIPDSVTSIGYWAFMGCTGLTSITIPNSVTSIDTWAFQNCTNLRLITLERTAAVGITQNGWEALENTHANLRIEVPVGSVSAYKAAGSWVSYANRIHAIGCTNMNNPCGVNCQ